MSAKNNKIEFDGRQYKTSDLSAAAKNLLNNIKKVNAVSLEKAKMRVVLTKAKDAYIAELKSEMLSVKSGFDFSE